MDFTRELTEFPSAVHRNIYTAARQLTPLDRSLCGMEDGALKESCKAYHAFMLDMLSDMYENPQAYGLPVYMLENFLNGRKLNGVKRKQPAQTEKIRSQTYNAVNGYQVLLCLLGRSGVVQGDVLSIPQEALKDIEKRSSGPSSPIDLSTRLEALSRMGLNQEGGSFVSMRCPNMFMGMCALANASEKMNSFGYFAFQNLEFRNIQSKYKPTYEDYTNPLISDRRAVADKINNCARKSNLKPACNTFWKVDYKYAGAQVMCLENDHGNMIIRITATYSWDDPALINNRLGGESPEFQQYILRHLWGCTGCSTSHLGAFAFVLGHKRRMCMGGGIGFRWTNPTHEDVEAIRKCIAFRCRIIDELKGK
jgi:hypothetical protein